MIDIGLWGVIRSLRELTSLLRKLAGAIRGCPPLEGVVEKRNGTVVELVETTVPFLFGARGRRPSFFVPSTGSGTACFSLPDSCIHQT